MHNFPCKQERTRLLRIKTWNTLFKDSSFYASYEKMVAFNSPTTSLFIISVSTTIIFLPYTRSFSRIVVAFHSRIRKFRFFFLAESHCNDFNLKRTPSWPFRSSPFLPFDFTQCMNVAREFTLNLRSSILWR